MKAVTLCLMFFISVIAFTACGGGHSSSSTQPTPTPQPAAQPIVVSLSESLVSMETSGESNAPNPHVFKADIQNASDATLIWSVNGVVGGDGMTGHGTVSAFGIYNAPVFIPSDGITVTATSRQDPSKSASAKILLSWNAAVMLSLPSGTQVKTGEQLQISASVITKGPSTITWTLNGIPIGSPQLGALYINRNWPNSVFFTAPPVKPTVPLTLTAISDANPLRSASAAITVLDSDPSEATVSIAPNYPSLELGTKQQFTATVTNSSSQASWSLMEGASKLASGFISGNGLYSAPYELPDQDVIVMATLPAYPHDKYAYAIVDLKPPAVSPNTRIHGNYVFALNDSPHQTHLLGRFTGDGNGHLSGMVDVNTSLGVLKDQSFTGTYSLGVDGRGSGTITYAPVAGTTINLGLRLMMQSDNLAFLYSNDMYMGQTIGRMEKQTPVAYSNSTLTGAYALLLRGLNSQPNPTPPFTRMTYPMAVAGILTADGAGALTGLADESELGALSQTSFTGTYTLDANGGGTITLTIPDGGSSITAHFVFVMASPQKFYLMTTDDMTAPSTTPALLLGTAEQQSGSFSNTALNGSFVFYDNAPGWAQLARFDSDGNGNISNGITDLRDWSVPGAIALSTNVPFTGTYSVGSNGRGTINISAGSQSGSGVLYMVSDNKFLVLYPASKAAAAGEGYRQENVSDFDWSTATDRYAVQFQGPMNPGLGWVAPSAGWLGWIDYATTIKNEMMFQLYPADGYGTGGMFATGMPMMRYYMVSDGTIFGIDTYQAIEANDFLVLQKIEP